MLWRAREQVRQQIQRQVDSQQSGAERNKLGQFATPYALARQIVSVATTYQTKPLPDVRFLEPSVGSGAFFSALLDMNAGVPPCVAEGFEIDSQLADVAKRLWSDYGLDVRCEDFTLATPPVEDTRKFNLLIANPPYVRHHHLRECQKRLLLRKVVDALGIRPNGLMGLYGYFMLLAHDWIQSCGLSVWLVPSEFMDVGYGDVLKGYLLNRVSLLRVHRFHAKDSKFTDADVTSSVVFLKKQEPGVAHRVRFSWGADLENPDRSKWVSVDDLRQVGKWSAIGKVPTPVLIASAHDIAGVRIGELFDVKRGLVTGANKFFILPRMEAQELDLPAKFLRPILPSPRHLANETVIEADDRGFPLVEPALVLLDCSVPADALGREYPILYRYVRAGEDRGLPERYLLSRRTPWYSQEQRPPAPIVCSYMGRASQRGKPIRFYRNRSMATASNVYLMLYLKPEIARLCEDCEQFLDHVFQLLLSLDQSEVLRHGRTYGGGLKKIEPGELPQVILPDSATVDDLLPRVYQPALL